MFYFNHIPRASFGSWYLSFIYGIRIDLSLAGYITALSMIVWIIYRWSNIASIYLLFRAWNYLAMTLYLLVTIADIAVYKHWNTKINLAAIQFASHPNEVMASIGSGDQPIWWFFVFVICLVLFVKIFNLLLYKPPVPLLKDSKFKLTFNLTSLLCLGVIVIMIRGGLQQNPINQSSAYYSEIPIQNHAAVNTTWSLIHKIIHHRGGKNPYHFGTEEQVGQALNTFYKKDTSSFKISSIHKPNIVFILLEGFTSDVISAFGGEAGLTPTIDSLIPHSLIWSRFYANGDRTYKGLPSILSGIPSQATSSITQNPDQSLAIPSLAKSLKTMGYPATFYYGGESEFANIKAYLLHTGYGRIVDINDFPNHLRGKKWGVPDHHVFERLAADLSRAKQPFFTTFLTLSSHEPYDIPMEPILKSTALPDLFRNTIIYTDQSLGKFLRLVENQPWYDSTLFVITADHGNPLPREYTTNFDPGKFKIPMILFGPALNSELKGKHSDKIGSQTDIAYSILTALGVHDSLTYPYRYSNNLLNASIAGSMYYTFDHGFGMINDQTKMAYDLNANKIVHREGVVNDSLIRLGQLLIQGTFDPKCRVN